MRRMSLNQAKSFNNGIMFYSEHNPNYVTMVTIDENQNTKIEWLSKEAAYKKVEQQNVQYEEKKSKTCSTLASFICIPLVIILFAYYLDVKFLRIFDGIMIPVFITGFVSLCIIAALMSSILDKKVAKWQKFHSAEHMILNAYRKLHRPPSLDELRHYSRFSTYCVTNLLIAILILCIALLIHLLFKVDFYLCYKIVLVFIVLLFLGGLNFIQLLVTEPPTDKELTMAIEGVKAWLENEQKEK